MFDIKETNLFGVYLVKIFQ